MAEKEPQFTVSDRRKFTMEGERRDGEETPDNAPSSEAAATASPASEEPSRATAAPPGDTMPEAETDEIAEPTAVQSAQQQRDYHASTRQLDDVVRQANPGAQGAAVMNFDRLVQSVYMTAAMQMGAAAEPNEQPRIDILGARQSIDTLGVLEEKTKGNLTDEEKRLLQTALFDLRMSFMDLTNAINKQAQQRPPQPGVKR